VSFRSFIKLAPPPDTTVKSPSNLLKEFIRAPLPLYVSVRWPWDINFLKKLFWKSKKLRKVKTVTLKIYLFFIVVLAQLGGARVILVARYKFQSYKVPKTEETKTTNTICLNIGQRPIAGQLFCV
jgi:hypothetical protein